MNVVERKALAAAIGVNVADLGKIVAGDKTSAEIAEEKAKKQEESLNKQMSMEIALAGVAAGTAAVQLTAAAAQIFGSFAKIPFGIGIPLAVAAVGSMFAMAKGAKGMVGLKDGGVVKETGMAEVHRGEVFSGTKNEAGFGTDMTETNGYLKQSLAESKKLREQNEFLMNRLTGRIDSLALSN